MVERAILGDVSAGRLLLSYALDRPKQRVEVESSEGYSVAGLSPAEGMRQMVDFINKRVSARTAYEKRVKKIHGDAS